MTAQGQPRGKLVLKALDEILAKVGSKDDAPPFIDDLKLTVGGCPDASQRFDAQTFIEALFIGLGIEQSAWQPQHCHLVVLERAGRRAQQFLGAGDVLGAVTFMTGDPLLNVLLWPEALEALREAPNLRALSPLTAAMSLDAHLGWLAA